MAETRGSHSAKRRGPGATAEVGETDLGRSLLELIGSTELGGREFQIGLEALRSEYGLLAYTHLLALLCHLRFEPEEARRRWGELLEHRQRLEERWGAPVDLRVALASFFLHVERRLENPTLIEMHQLEQTQAFAYRDQLTGLRNYRFFELYMAHELQRSAQYGWPLSLILLDIDNFKPYNDRHGHTAGNQVLAEFGRLLAAACRKVDISARYGGEEFAIIAPSTPKLGAEQVAERARHAIAAHDWGPDHLTVSAGVATYPGDATDVGELVRRADEALYLAKARGKNQVQLYGGNRRSHRRVQVELEGLMLAPALQPHPVTTVDVSEAGLRFTCDVELPEGTLVDIRLDLPGSSGGITVAGRVVQSNREAAVSGAAIRVVDLSAEDRRLLAEYLSEAALMDDDGRA